jgi:hypothetical protein
MTAQIIQLADFHQSIPSYADTLAAARRLSRTPGGCPVIDLIRRCGGTTVHLGTIPEHRRSDFVSACDAARGYALRIGVRDWPEHPEDDAAA